MIKKEHILQRLDAATKNLQEAWEERDKIKIIALYNAVTMAQAYINQTEDKK